MSNDYVWISKMEEKEYDVKNDYVWISESIHPLQDVKPNELTVMSSNPFLPSGNSVAISLSTASNSAYVGAAPAFMFTNRSNSNAFVTWAHDSARTAVFPTPDDLTGSFGVEVVANAQVTISTGYVGAYVSAVLLSGTGVGMITPGDGL